MQYTEPKKWHQNQYHYEQARCEQLGLKRGTKRTGHKNFQPIWMVHIMFCVLITYLKKSFRDLWYLFCKIQNNIFRPRTGNRGYERLIAQAGPSTEPGPGLASVRGADRTDNAAEGFHIKDLSVVIANNLKHLKQWAGAAINVIGEYLCSGIWYLSGNPRVFAPRCITIVSLRSNYFVQSQGSYQTRI